MATNDFKPFATGAGANVTDQADWESLPALSGGFTAGKAASMQVNKALRQSTSMASVLAQFIADSSGNDVLDDGDTALILENMKSGLLSASPGRLIGVQIIKTSGTYVPTLGTKKMIVEIIGGGGAGGGSQATTSGNASMGSGGSEGCYGKSIFTDIEESYTVTIGAGGTPVTGGYGNPGGTSTFGNLMSASGGMGGGIIAPGSTPLMSGIVFGTEVPTITGANISSSTYGGSFIFAVRLSASVAGAGTAGMGGRSPFGDGGGSHTSSGPGGDAKSYGAGGSGAKSFGNGAADVAYAGGRGGDGVVMVWEYA